MSTSNSFSQARALPALSSEVKNILDEPPAWLVRWGSVLLLGAVLTLLCAAGFVRYPSVITGAVTLYAAPQTTFIERPASTATYALRVHPGQEVQAEQLLAIVRQGAVERALTAPFAGTVLVPSEPTGTALLRLLPAAPAQQSVVTLAASQSSRVRIGQRVLLNLDYFPSAKFGKLTGRVMSVARPAINSNQTLVAIKLDHGYCSTYGTKLAIKSTEHGTAEIIATEESLLAKVLKKYLSMLKMQ